MTAAAAAATAMSGAVAPSVTAAAAAAPALVGHGEQEPAAIGGVLVLDDHSAGRLRGLRVHDERDPLLHGDDVPGLRLIRHGEPEARPAVGPGFEADADRLRAPGRPSPPRPPPRPPA